MKTWLFSLLFSGLAVCSSGQSNKQISIEGHYKSSPPDLGEWFRLRLKGVTGHIVDRELVLQSDSTFTLLSCNTIAYGNWKFSTAQVLLYFTRIAYRKDVSMENGPPLTVPQEVYILTLRSGKLYGLPDRDQKTIEIFKTK